MPGVNPPPNEYFLRQLVKLQQDFLGLATNQQMTWSNANDQVILTAGLLPGYTPPIYGIALWDPVSGKLQGVIGERSGYPGSAIVLLSPTGVAVFSAGTTYIPDGSNRTQQSVSIYRDDGSPALVMSDLGVVPNHAHQQALQWFDRSGNTVLSDDTLSGTGVARPHIPSYALMNTNTTTWPSTTATSATTISACYMEYQQPKIQWAINLYAPPSVTALFTLQYNNTTLGTQSVVGGGGGNLYSWSGVAAVPSGLSFGSVYALTLQGQITAGTGTIYGQSLLIQGQGS